MSGESSSTVEWFSLLEPSRAEPPDSRRPDDPRLGEIIERWDGSIGALQFGRGVIVGFPQDEGVRRNGGRIGAAKAPDEIRKRLYRLTPAHVQRRADLASMPPLDAGNVRGGSLEECQASLGSVVGGIMSTGAVPVVLGGGHETAYGHFLGYVNGRIPVAIINVDAHLDVRPTIDGLGHSGSAFRQAMEHPTSPLPGSRYCCVGAQPFAVSVEHFRYVRKMQGRVWWRMGAFPDLTEVVTEEIKQLAADGCSVMLSVDADAFSAADVPGVSAPNPMGFPGAAICQPALVAGESREVASFEVSEVNPALDIDGRSAHWAAVAVWHFLIGLSQRARITNS